MCVCVVFRAVLKLCSISSSIAGTFGGHCSWSGILAVDTFVSVSFYLYLWHVYKGQKQQQRWRRLHVFCLLLLLYFVYFMAFLCTRRRRRLRRRVVLGFRSLSLSLSRPLCLFRPLARLQRPTLPASSLNLSSSSSVERALQIAHTHIAALNLFQIISD